MNSINNVYEKLHALGLQLPEAPARGGVYASAKSFGNNLVYISGCGPSIGGAIVQGKLGQDLSIEEGQLHARNCMLNVLAVLQAHIEDLNKVRQVVKITAFVASDNNFYEQPKVANGGSGLLVDLFGEAAGAPSRSAIGVNVLPGNIPVEIEALFELNDPEYPD
ncbi:MAG: RidA family protein [Bacillota bacterium]|nr:RidA family protein [Bacillota bacterium]